MLTRTPPSDTPTQVSLKRRVLNAGAWSVAGYGASQAIRFGANLLITRLLAPEMFGVMAIATIVMVGLQMFSDLGLHQSIVQSRRGDDPAFLDTAWVTQIVRGFLLWAIALAIALLLGLAGRLGLFAPESVYSDPQLPSIVAVLSFSAVIGGFASTKRSQATRKLALGRVTLIDLASQITGLALMFAWLTVDRSIWALVAGALFGSLATTVLSHTSLPGSPNRWRWEASAFREIFHFGKWIFISSILGFLEVNSDRLLLGGMVDTPTLGVYVIAFTIFSSVEQLLTRSVAGVIYPALSEVARQDPDDLKRKCYQFHWPVASVVYFSSGFLMMAGEALIGLLYDPRYADAGWMLRILSGALLAIPFQIPIKCFMALGMPHVYSKSISIRLAFFFVATPIGFLVFGLAGALWAIVLSYFSYLPVLIFYALSHGLFDIRRELFPLPFIIVGMSIGILFAPIFWS